MAAQARMREFTDRFGFEPEVVTSSPGRINLIGEHTDYNEGFVFPAAIDRHVTVAARRADANSSITSLQLGEGEPFDVSSVEPGAVEGWAAYAAGMAWALRETGLSPLPNIEATVTSDLPIGSGVSSSAAIELAFGLAFLALASKNVDPTELAKIAQRCENEFVGVNSGIMDQLACAMGREGHAMFIDTRSLGVRYVELPRGLSVAICDTLKPRQLADSKYNERRAQCERASAALGVPALRDADMGQLEAKRAELGELIFRRARHVISENRRCLEFVEALEASDLDRMGRLMMESHVSLRDDYEVSCRELDAMAAAAAAAPGCVGARMTGAGFGGVCVALVRDGEVRRFGEATSAGYQAATGVRPEITTCMAADGAKVLFLNLI